MRFSSCQEFIFTGLTCNCNSYMSKLLTGWSAQSRAMRVAPPNPLDGHLGSLARLQVVPS